MRLHAKAAAAEAAAEAAEQNRLRTPSGDVAAVMDCTAVALTLQAMMPTAAASVLVGAFAAGEASASAATAAAAAAAAAEVQARDSRGRENPVTVSTSEIVSTLATLANVCISSGGEGEAGSGAVGAAVAVGPKQFCPQYLAGMDPPHSQCENLKMDTTMTRNLKWTLKTFSRTPANFVFSVVNHVTTRVITVSHIQIHEFKHVRNFLKWHSRQLRFCRLRSRGDMARHIIQLTPNPSPAK